jgi:hypothetical protein
MIDGVICYRLSGEVEIKCSKYRSDDIVMRMDNNGYFLSQ